MSNGGNSFKALLALVKALGATLVVALIGVQTWRLIEGMMSLFKFLIPVVLVGGGALLLFNEAKASEKKKRVSKAYELGLDDVDDSETQPPLPPAMSRAIPANPIDHQSFNAWWYQTGWAETGVMGFWTDITSPLEGTEWVLPGINPSYNDVILATNDGALWYHDNGWHPAPLLAQDYDAWVAAGMPE